jgi:hypothetical protein
MARSRGKEASGKFSHAHHGSESPPSSALDAMLAGRSTASYGKSFEINIYQ